MHIIDCLDLHVYVRFFPSLISVTDPSSWSIQLTNQTRFQLSIKHPSCLFVKPDRVRSNQKFTFKISLSPSSSCTLPTLMASFVLFFSVIASHNRDSSTTRTASKVVVPLLWSLCLLGILTVKLHNIFQKVIYHLISPQSSPVPVLYWHTLFSLQIESMFMCCRNAVFT